MTNNFLLLSSRLLFVIPQEYAFSFFAVQWAGLDTSWWGLSNNFWESVTRVSKGIVFAG